MPNTTPDQASSATSNTTPPQVVVYSADYCPYCDKAKDLLKAKGAQYKEINVTHDDDAKQEIMQKTGLKTVPQVFIGEEFIGGFDKLRDLDQAGELDKKLGL